MQPKYLKIERDGKHILIWTPGKDSKLIDDIKWLPTPQRGFVNGRWQVLEHDPEQTEGGTTNLEYIQSICKDCCDRRNWIFVDLGVEESSLTPQVEQLLQQELEQKLQAVNSLKQLFLDNLAQIEAQRQALIEEESGYTRKFGARRQQMGRNQRDLQRRIGLLGHAIDYAKLPIDEMVDPHLLTLLAASSEMDFSVDSSGLALMKQPFDFDHDLPCSIKAKRGLFYPDGLKIYGLLPFVLAYKLRATFCSDRVPGDEHNFTVVRYQQQPDIVQALVDWLCAHKGFVWKIAQEGERLRDSPGDWPEYIEPTMTLQAIMNKRFGVSVETGEPNTPDPTDVVLGGGGVLEFPVIGPNPDDVVLGGQQG